MLFQRYYWTSLVMDIQGLKNIFFKRVCYTDTVFFISLSDVTSVI